MTQELLSKLRGQLNSLVFSNSDEIDLVIAAFLARGHVLIEDVPGVGKTLLAQAMAQLLGLNFSRIQFTSDLLPADVLGNMIFNEQTQKFQFHRGPIFNQVVLADELNRTSPRTQSAFLQAMEESEVTVDGQRYSLPAPFHVIATQNPLSQMGTYSLPESQVDRFLIAIELRAVDREDEIKLIQGKEPRKELAKMPPVLPAGVFEEWQRLVDQVHVSRIVAEYVSALLSAGRSEGLQISARAGMAIGRLAKAVAWMQGRDAVITSDVQKVFTPVLSLRISDGRGVQVGKKVAHEILAKVQVVV